MKLIGNVLAGVLGVALWGTVPVAAQEFPTRPVRMVVANSAGTLDDLLARALGGGMATPLGQPIIVENRPGGSGLVGYLNAVKLSPADGYTIMMTQPVVLATLPLATKDVGFDPATDIPPILGLGEARAIIGSAAHFPWKSVQELVAYAKANPGKLNYGSSSLSSRIPIEIFLKAVGISVTYVPYGGGAQYLQGLVSGDVQMGIIVEQPALGWGSKFRVLAVTGEGRSAKFPAVPNFAELGIRDVPSIEYTLNARLGIPRTVLDKLSAAASLALKQPEVRAQFAKVNLDVVERSAAETAKRLAAQVKRFMEVGKELGIEPQ